jgi:hypothetical protein
MNKEGFHGPTYTVNILQLNQFSPDHRVNKLCRDAKIEIFYMKTEVTNQRILARKGYQFKIYRMTPRNITPNLERLSLLLNWSILQILASFTVPKNRMQLRCLQHHGI